MFEMKFRIFPQLIVVGLILENIENQLGAILLPIDATLFRSLGFELTKIRTLDI